MFSNTSWLIELFQLESLRRLRQWGRKLKSTHFPELSTILHLILRSKLIYDLPQEFFIGVQITPWQWSEILLSVAPKEFSISLSPCFRELKEGEYSIQAASSRSRTSCPTGQLSMSTKSLTVVMGYFISWSYRKMLNPLFKPTSHRYNIPGIPGKKKD